MEKRSTTREYKSEGQIPSPVILPASARGWHVRRHQSRRPSRSPSRYPSRRPSDSPSRHKNTEIGHEATRPPTPGVGKMR
ncbi:ankyrin repeat protein [Lasius niger]|uniref:Ankyrin repeat protein n=1 Tax=Lasius niger TaxID=67767 RepID=A0A0J7NIJ2_LASNI|nr:ankyrin repeat protein [Lasius niger]